MDKERAEEDSLVAFAEAIAEALSPTSIDQEELADLRACSLGHDGVIACIDRNYPGR